MALPPQRHAPITDENALPNRERKGRGSVSNRIFQSYEDIVDLCCEAWNKVVDQPWRIMSIGLRQ